ncbi:MAG: hypothetical protein NVS3B20_17740 [Polyangiales bacterium]
MMTDDERPGPPNDAEVALPRGKDAVDVAGRSVSEPLAWSERRLFDQYFRPLYPEDMRSDEAIALARRVDANPGRNPRIVGQLAEIAQLFAQLAPGELPTLNKATLQHPGDLDFSDASVHRLGQALDLETRNRLLDQSRPSDPGSKFVSLVTHGAIYVGECIVRNYGETWGETWGETRGATRGETRREAQRAPGGDAPFAAWGVRRPLWESVVHLQSHAGVAALAPFHWLLKALADVEIGKGGLVSRYRHYVERATTRPDALPQIVSTHLDRPFPVLKVTRYDMLHKYLKANLPELRDVGRDFPSIEEWQALGFLEVQFMLLGDGRMLLIHGRGKRGLHLLWLDHQGFSHAMFLPASPGDPHSVEVVGNKLVIRFHGAGAARVHEMLWWG